jgi:glycosyltransferase involved in cell wall biosynthesis
VEAGVATALSEQTGVPIVVSVHGTYDRDPIRPGNFIDSLMNPFRLKLFRWVLSSANKVVGVYEDASDFARRMGALAPITIYNELGVSSEVAESKQYLPGEIVRVGCINRQDSMKDPRNIVRAIAQFPQIHLTLVGDGPLHAEIEKLISDLDLSHRIECIEAMPNAEWLHNLASMDLYVTHCDYAGISKGVLEAALLGLPIVINRNDPIANEYLKDWVYLCDGSVKGYAKGIGDLLADTDLMRTLGNGAKEFADAHCSAIQVRKLWQNLYLGLVKES